MWYVVAELIPIEQMVDQMLQGMSFGVNKNLSGKKHTQEIYKRKIYLSFTWVYNLSHMMKKCYTI
jgi:hypothetical protein